MHDHQALILVDLQNDFCPGGSLAVPNGNEVISIANRLANKFKLVIATQDWHPNDHLSFASNHSKLKVGDTILLNGVDQLLWPNHCVQGSYGAQFHPALNLKQITHIVQKGVDRNIDSYSAFFDNAHLKDTGLHTYLSAKHITHLTILGLATEYCVKFTALDAVELGYEVTVVVDGCRGIERYHGDIDTAYQMLASAGVKLCQSTDFLKV